MNIVIILACIIYDYMPYMDYMDPDGCCPKKAVKLIHSLTHLHVTICSPYVTIWTVAKCQQFEQNDSVSKLE